MALPELSLQPLARTVLHWTMDRQQSQFDLDAPYQRGSVWTDAQRQSLIKSLLIGLPVGSIITSHQGYQVEMTYRVVDGKQRVLAVQAFVANEFMVPAEWWDDGDVDNLATGRRWVLYTELTARGRRRFENRHLPELQADLRTEVTRAPTTMGWERRDRSKAEILKAEAELFLLVNMAGTGQDAEHLARVEDLT